mmetsp:Transcript_29417/g.47495  ORF Transcript_29417/g.47495 Transcript_29417/m.47495 type:complete len:368 (+) Transcript_29417:112-1215(+)
MSDRHKSTPLHSEKRPIPTFLLNGAAELEKIGFVRSVTATALEPNSDLQGFVDAVWKVSKPFVLAAASGCVSATILLPVDKVKVRMQLFGEGVAGARPSMLRVLKDIVADGGILGLYQGFTAALVRQATWATTRLGMFRFFTEEVKETYKGRKPPLYAVYGAGFAAGGIASVIQAPADLILTRIQADGALPLALRRNYGGVVDAFGRIIRNEGVLALWRGCGPTVVKHMCANGALMASFDKSKEFFSEKLGPGFLRTQLPAAAVSGLIAASIALPFDFVKTRLQKQIPNAVGELPFKHALACVVHVLRTEGPLAFYKGFPAFYLRVAPNATLTLMAFDFIQGVINKDKDKEKEKKSGDAVHKKSGPS